MFHAPTPARSATVMLLPAMFDMYICVPSLLSMTMWVPFWPVPRSMSTCRVAGSYRPTTLLSSAVK
jgi:hypothetical protein